jgi:hypothetical protein
MSSGLPPAGSEICTMGTLPLEYISDNGIHVLKSSPCARSTTASWPAAFSAATTSAASVGEPEHA